MKRKWLVAALLLVLAFRLAAQSAETNESFDQTKAKAERGDAGAQNNLGYCYDSGDGVRKDAAEAVKWYRKAAEQGLAIAQCNVGRCYQTGCGVRKDAAQAVKWFSKAAKQGYAGAQDNLGVCYENGAGVPRDAAEAVKWYRKAAEQGYANAQKNLGLCYSHGNGVPKDAIKAVEWFRKGAEQANAGAENDLGWCYDNGSGVPKDVVEAVKWFRKAAEQGDAFAQRNLGLCYAGSEGVPKDFVEAYKWANLASAQDDQEARRTLDWLERRMAPDQVAEGQRLSREFNPHKSPNGAAREAIADPLAAGSGTGFFITEDGFLITNEHVVKDAAEIRVVTSAGTISARVVRVDAANDLALLKTDGHFTSLPVASSRSVRLGGSVATVGFPNIGLQGFSPKLAKGEIASLSGPQDDPRYFQISVPIQPGNSGGALVDERGNVVGIVSAKLDAAAALITSGSLPENVNYAVKSSFLLGFLESVPEVSAKLKDANAKERKFEDVVESAEQAAVSVLIY